jgi:hypothetical protein
LKLYTGDQQLKAKDICSIIHSNLQMKFIETPGLFQRNNKQINDYMRDYNLFCEVTPRKEQLDRYWSSKEKNLLEWGDLFAP